MAEAEGPVPVYINLQETAGEAPAANTAVRAAVEKEAGGAAEFFRRMGLFILNALPWLAGAGVLIGAVIFLRRRGKKR